MVFIWLRRIVWFFLFVVSLCATAGCFYYYHVQKTLPDVALLKVDSYETPLQIYSKDNLLIGEFGTQRRIPIGIDEIPGRLKDAFLATEDNRFYEHFGIDPIGIFRAIKASFSKGAKRQGASTITQQVARNFFLSREKTYTRKIKEIFISFKIEQTLTKDEILSLYLNKIALGHHAYGVAAAAFVYFGKTVDELTLGECAMLAGLPKAPSDYNPISHPDRARQRRHTVLSQMLRFRKITREQFEEADNEPIEAYYHAPKIEANAGYVAESIRQTLENEFGDSIYTDGYKVYATVDSTVQEKANQALYNGLTDYDMRHGYRKPENIAEKNISIENRGDWLKELGRHNLYDYIHPALVTSVNSDNSVNFTLYNDEDGRIKWENVKWASSYRNERKDAKLPAERILMPGDIIFVHKKEDGEYGLRQVPQVQGAIVSVNAQTGAILAMAGGYSYKQSSFNRVELSRRQAGSNIKPFLYSAALTRGFNLGSYMLDDKFSIWNPWSKTTWSPKNSPNVYEGFIPLREALAKSKNVVSVRLLQRVGIGNFIKHLKKFGINVTNKFYQNLSLALGAYEITPLELVTAYSTFANGGYKIEPYLIDRIVRRDNEQLVFEADPPIACPDCADAVENKIDPVIIPEEAKYLEENNYAEQVITHGNAFLISDTLHTAIFGGRGPEGWFNGTGARARAMNRPDISGKTGTTNESRDTWFSGFNYNIATTVWVGYDNFAKSLGRGESGARTALPIWIEIMSYLLKGQPEATLPKPEYIVTNGIFGYPEYMIKTGDGDGIYIGNESYSNESYPVEEPDASYPEPGLTPGLTPAVPQNGGMPKPPPSTIEDLY